MGDSVPDRTSDRDRTMGNFGVIVLVLFIGACVYLLGGIFLGYMKGATGMEMIPNVGFWARLHKRFTLLVFGVFMFIVYIFADHPDIGEYLLLIFVVGAIVYLLGGV